MAFSEKAYIKSKCSWLYVKNVSRNLAFEDIPKLAIKLPEGKPIAARNAIVAIGREAESAQFMATARILVLDGFDHPRTIIGDFEIAELTLKEFLKRVKAIKRIYWEAPILVFHPMEKLKGGLSQIEALALLGIGKRLGAKRAIVWIGRELTDEEVLEEKFPSRGVLFNGVPYPQEVA